MGIESEQLIKLNQVLQACAISRSAMYEMIARNEFPVPVQVGRRAVAWRQKEVLEWIRSRPKRSIS